MIEARHAPVMADEALAALAPLDRGVYVDATLGGGGYSRAILAAADCSVYAFDRDPAAIQRAREWAPAYGARLTLINRPFAEMESALEAFDIDAIDGVVFDLGVSSMQIDEAERGFSFRADGPLSMRMDGGKPDAGDVIMKAEARDLQTIFKIYGEERRAGAIARAIVKAREATPVETTGKLAEIVAKAAPSHGNQKIHPATRAFQALRIFVNDELGQFAEALAAAERLLRPASRLVAVTFHSLEDRIVKRFLAQRSGGASGAPSRHAPPRENAPASFRLLYSKARSPSPAETDRNPRSRSAKLRAAVRLDAPALACEPATLGLPKLEFSKALDEWRS
ncbi:MAG: 16S rRNA (cytosine(1402)-N(4))-methyltransferase RsmH [Parvularculaceae bacterium]